MKNILLCTPTALWVLVLFAWAVTPSSAATLGYHWQPDQKFSYRVEISVQVPESPITYEGTVHYTVQSVSGEQVRLSYQGGLIETRDSHHRFAPRSAFAGMQQPPGAFFGRPTYSGTIQTTNQITMTIQGQVLAMEGDSQLPFLLGNLSLLPFEPLPSDDRQEWGTDGGIAITEKSDRANGLPPGFPPIGPFANHERSKFRTANEVVTYEIVSEDAAAIVIKKTHRLETPISEGETAIDVNGSGTWTFDPVAHVPASLDYKSSLQIKTANVTISVPVTKRFNLMTEAEVAKLEADKKAAAEARAKASVEAKAAAERPLTADEKRSLLTDLKASQDSAVRSALDRLAQKKPVDSDPEVVEAITPLINHENRLIVSAAERALSRWSPEFEKKNRIAGDYKGPGTVESTDLPIESTTPLFVGQIVQINDDFWFPAVIEELMSDGKVRVARMAQGRTFRSQIVPRNRLQLAPPELDQPKRPEQIEQPMKSASSPDKARIWSDASGKFKQEAEFVSLFEGKVNLKYPDGRIISVPLEKLSEADQQYVKSTQQEPENPFAQ